MMIRIVLASLLGGVLMFFAGAFCHVGLELESRFIVNTPNEESLKAVVSQQRLSAGMYGFPGKPADYNTMSAEQQTSVMQKLNQEYKDGPAAILIVAPTGEDMMSAKQLVGELVANVGAAFFASVLLYLLRPEVSLIARWLLLVTFAPLSWLNLTFSNWLWYRFSFGFVLDGLYGAVVEWAIAGLVIAAIARPSTKTSAGAAPSQN